MTEWRKVRAVIRSESEITHEVAIDMDEYREWLAEQKWTEGPETLRRFLTRDEEWHDQFSSRTLIDEELWEYDVRSAEWAEGEDEQRDAEVGGR